MTKSCATSFCLLLAAAGIAGCAAVPAPGNPPAPPTAPDAQVIEYRQLISKNAVDLARLAAEFTDVTATAYARTNLVLVRGTRKDVDMAIDLINKLEFIAWCGGDLPQLSIRHLKHAHAAELLPLLDRMSVAGFFDFGDINQSLPPERVVFSADPRLNVIMISYINDETLTHVNALIDELDKPQP